MDSLYDLSDLFESRNKRGLGDFHLRSALLLVEWDRLTEGGGRFRERKAAKKILSRFRKDLVIAAHPVELFCQLLFEDVMPTAIPKKEDVVELLKIESLALRKLISEKDLFNKAIRELEEMSFSRTEFAIKRFLTAGLMYLMAITSEREFEEVEEIKYSAFLDCKYLSIGTTQIYLFGEIIGFRRFGNRTLNIISLDGYRMIVDKFTERSNVLLASRIGHQVLPEIYPSVKTIDQIFLLFDRHLYDKGNSGYKLLKTFEALITGIILKRQISIYWDTEEFWKNTIIDFEDSEREIAQDLLSICEDPCISVHHLTQIMGLFRLWGHPVVDAKKGVEKVRTVGAADKNISEFISEKAGWKFLEILFMNFYSKNDYYPDFEILPNAEVTYLQETLIAELPINLKDPAYHLLQWESIIVKKTFDIPSSFNLSMIVADTAISPTRSEIKAFQESGKSALDPTIRRGVLKWMKDGVLDCPSLLNFINENPTGLDKENLIIGLYQKERELNPIARMFALMSLMMRAYVVVTESILADHILPLIPGITMTYSMLELTKEMIKTTWRQKSDDPHSVTFCINMDFEKWNLNMRRESTYHVFKNLGRLFGLDEIYNRTYDIFENSIIYLADGSYDLKLDEELDCAEPDNNLAYIGHKGGFEGLRQKGWTVFTVVLISYVCNNLNIDWKLMGQGDNQVLLATIHSKFSRSEGITSPIAVDEIKTKLKELLQELLKTFKMVGLPLKPLETWVSDKFFAYGKYPIYKGVPCAMSLKKISRIFFFSNEDIMTLDNAMGSIVTNAQSAAMSDVLPVIPYFIAKWQQLLCIGLFSSYHPLLGKAPLEMNRPKFLMSNKDGLKKVYQGKLRKNHKYYHFALVSFPKTLGGINCVTYFNMIMRGFSDPVNMDYQWLIAMSRSATGDFQKLLINLKNLMLNDERNFSYLLQDPVGLNLFVPKNSSQAVKQMIHKVIEGLPFNSQFASWFKEVMKISDPVEIEKLVQKLTDQEVLNVRFLHDILGSTIFGYCDSITSKVDKTVTLSRIALSQADVVGKIMKTETKFINYLYWRIVVNGNFIETHSCSSAYIREAREIGWGKKLEGVSVPFPFEYLTRDPCESNMKDSYLEGIIDDQALVTNSYTLNSVGRSLPYLGSVTMEKLPVSTTRLAYGTEPLISRPIRLLRSVGWFVEKDSNFHHLLNDLVGAVTDLETDKMTLIPERVKGSMIHRYSDFATKHGSLWLPLYGPATFINLSTNHFHQFSRGSKNVTLHFQATLCYFQFLIVSSILSSNKVKVIKLWRSCNSCIVPILDNFIDLKERIPMELIPSRPENPYLYLPEKKINLQQKKTELRMRMIRRASLNEITVDDVHSCIAEWLSLRIAFAIIYKSDDQNDNLLDVSGVSRTLFLKVHPHVVLRSLARSLFIIVSMGKKYQNKFPSFPILKNDIIRTVERCPVRNFSLFAGYYLWPETQAILREYGSSFPDTYPTTPDSASKAAKRTIIRHLRATTKLSFNKIGLIFYGYENHLNYLLKLSSMSRLVKPNSCVYCSHSVLTRKYNFDEISTPIMLEKCELGHNFVSLDDVQRIFYIPDINIDSIVDLLPSLPVPHSNDSTVLKLDRSRELDKLKIGKNLLENTKIGEGGLIRVKTHLFCNEQSTPIENVLDQCFNHPTRGFYRMLEILNSSAEIREGNLLVLGDGYGMSSLAASAYSKSKFKIVSWTYAEPSSGISHSLLESKPPVIYNFGNLIDISPTFSEIGDVGHPDFFRGFARVVQEHKIDRLISDIEWWYLGTDYSDKLIDLCYSNKINYISLRLFTSCFDELIDALEVLNRCYENWRIIETKNINRQNREVLVIAWRCRRIKDHCFHFIDRDIWRIRDIVYSYEIINLGTLQEQRSLFVKLIDEELIVNSLWMSWVEDTCQNWYGELGLNGWKNDSFTALLNSLRTGRRPYRVANLTGQDLYYSRDDWEESVVERLLALAISLTDSHDSWSEPLRDNWWLSWDIDPKRRMFGGQVIYNISIRREGVRQQVLSKKTTRISHYAGLVRAVRLANNMKIPFSRIGNIVTFRFVSKRVRQQEQASGNTEVYFAISKNASYGTEEMHEVCNYIYQ